MSKLTIINLLVPNKCNCHYKGITIDFKYIFMIKFKRTSTGNVIRCALYDPINNKSTLILAGTIRLQPITWTNIEESTETLLSQ